jgi:hypothetical protein
MSEAITTDTLVAGENVQPVNTDAAAEAKAEAKKSEKATPSVETRDGKLFVDGVRVYTRDDTNRIAARAQEDARARFLSELEVDDFDQVKKVVKSLQGNVDGDLNVQTLRDAVKKKEQTVEELRAELQRIKTDVVLKDHINQLYNSMPAQWNTDQRSAVVDLMKARNMLHLEGETFAIRNGDTFLTQDGETPDYGGAVTLIGKTLGLPMAKQGVATFDAADRAPADNAVNRAVDLNKLQSDSAYRAAYVQVRDKNRNLSRSEITDAMVRKQQESHKMGSFAERRLSGSAPQASITTKNRR